MAFTLTSSAFASGAAIPARFGCDGADLSPALEWAGVPAGTRSLALVCADPDAPRGTWYHWAAYDLPADLAGLAEGWSPDGDGSGREAVNDFGRPGYGGPCPPPGHGTHHYRFTLFALDVDRLAVAAGARCLAVERAAERAALARAVLIGTYAR